MSLADAQSKIDDWRMYYNEVRPHLHFRSGGILGAESGAVSGANQQR
ncbi:hypothetical protein BCEP27_170055 [Burkholderia cepacia]